MTVALEGVQTREAHMFPDHSERWEIVPGDDRCLYVAPHCPPELASAMFAYSEIVPRNFRHVGRGEYGVVFGDGSIALKYAEHDNVRAQVGMPNGGLPDLAVNAGLYTGLGRLPDNLQSEIAPFRFSAPAIYAAVIPHPGGEATPPAVWAMDFVEGEHPRRANDILDEQTRHRVYHRALVACGFAPTQQVDFDDHQRNMLVKPAQGVGVEATKIDVVKFDIQALKPLLLHMSA